MIGRRGSRSTSTPLGMLSTANGNDWSAANAPTSTGPAPNSSIAAVGRASAVTHVPSRRMLCPAQSFRTSASRQRRPPRFGAHRRPGAAPSASGTAPPAALMPARRHPGQGEACIGAVRYGFANASTMKRGSCSPSGISSPLARRVVMAGWSTSTIFVRRRPASRKASRYCGSVR